MWEDKTRNQVTEKEIEQLWETHARSALQQAVIDAERGIAAGEWIDHTEIAARLKSWAGDESPE